MFGERAYLQLDASLVVTERVVTVVFAGSVPVGVRRERVGGVVSVGVVLLGAVLTTMVTSSLAGGVVAVVAVSLKMYVPAIRFETVV